MTDWLINHIYPPWVPAVQGLSLMSLAVLVLAAYCSFWKDCKAQKAAITAVADMTYRQWLVGMAINGMLANSTMETLDDENPVTTIIELANGIADAQLAREAKEAGDERG